MNTVRGFQRGKQNLENRITVLPVAVINYPDQEQPREEKACFTAQLGSQGKNSRQELQQRPWRSAAYWPALHVQAAFFYKPE